jgi:dipeptidase D
MSAQPRAPSHPDTTTLLAALQPPAVWRHFATLCAIPRMSRHEERLRGHIRAWAEALGLPARVDGAGNLVVTKPASAGHEGAPVMALQAHLDMVCQKNAESPHDFARDPIVPQLRDGWLAAGETTLGADDGIGVALMMAVLEDRRLVHGPLEALFTVDEETGMSGAKGLAPGELRATAMLNLDTEEWGEFYLGCAGGIDVNVKRPGKPQALPAGHAMWRVRLRGLRGGHSGVDIHEERGNAIKLLVRVLHELERRLPLRLASLEGGSARNALPREAYACIALPGAASARLAPLLAQAEAELRRELKGVDEGLGLDALAAPDGPVLAAAEQRIWLDTLHAAPHGVRRMSRQVPGVVETSNNLGMVELTASGGSCNFMVRSLLDEGCRTLAGEIASLFALSATPVEISGQYPGWTPNADSRLLALCRAVYRRDFGADAQIKVIHAGLECGIIVGKYPELDIVSFGPTIRGAHAPGERVEVASVARCWDLLTAILAQAARTPI